MGKSAEATAVISEQALKLLQSVDSFVSVPGVGAAAEAALSILALTLKSNKTDFISVGEKACIIMVTVIRKVNVAEQPDREINRSSLQKECDDLRRTLETVKSIVDKHVKGRKRFVLLKRVLYSRLDQDVIKDCKDRLQTALDLFNVQSHIEVRQGVEDANKKLDHLVERGGEGTATKVTQHAGRNAYTRVSNNSVNVSGTGNSVNVSSVAPSPTYYQPSHSPTYYQPSHSPTYYQPGQSPTHYQPEQYY